MIQKVLIAEDQQSGSISIQKTMEDLKMPSVNYVYYCDDALMEINQAVKAGRPYDLLITDLVFEPDHRTQQIQGGAALVAAARAVQPDLAVLVFSAESRPSVIEALIDGQQIDAYVRKARHDVQTLCSAIDHINRHQRYFPRELQLWIQQKNAHQFTSYDITVIELLSRGMRQKDIPAYLQANQVQPAGLSSIEKRLNLIREKLGCANNEQLVAFCKDKGVI